MPAAPIMGFIFFFANRLMNFAKKTPPTVSNTNATRPSPRTSSVCGRRNLSALIVAAMESPRKRVTRFASTFCAVSESAFRTPHSRSRFPNIRQAMSGRPPGATMPTTNVITIGNRIRVSFETSRCSYSMRISRSCLVVISFITGRCIIGTRAI